MPERPVAPALLIIDMQNDFADPGTRLYSSHALQIVTVINELTHIARIKRIPVIWVVQQHRRQLVDFGREGDISPVHCVEGSYGAELISALKVEASDFTVIKRRYSAFYATDLDLLLRCLNRNMVILTGIATDGCVQATALDAQARDYYVRVVRDATATGSQTAHEAALVAMGRMQPGVVISLEEALNQINDREV
ncbi:MAG: cysteine hydrolase [Chloroflexi bacterium]|nr:cysteine hydrolase [Chloroflexota bacterium]